MTSERFKEITARCQPHPVFSSDWTHYYSNDFADSLLPEAGIVKGKHLQFYDGAEIVPLNGAFPQRFLYLSPNSTPLALTFFSFPKGVKACEKWPMVQPDDNELCAFFETDINDRMKVCFRAGEVFKNYLHNHALQYGTKDLSAHIGSLVAVTNIGEFQAFFKDEISHYKMLSFIGKMIKIDMTPQSQIVTRGVLVTAVTPILSEPAGNNKRANPEKKHVFIRIDFKITDRNFHHGVVRIIMHGEEIFSTTLLPNVFFSGTKKTSEKISSVIHSLKSVELGEKAPENENIPSGDYYLYWDCTEHVDSIKPDDTLLILFDFVTPDGQKATTQYTTPPRKVLIRKLKINNFITILGEDDEEIRIFGDNIIERQNKFISRIPKEVYDRLKDEFLLILHLPEIMVKLDWLHGALCQIHWLEGSGKSLKFPYEFFMSEKRVENVDRKNLEEYFKEIMCLDKSDCFVSTSEGDRANLFLYNTKWDRVKDALSKFKENLPQKRTGEPIGNDLKLFYEKSEYEKAKKDAPKMKEYINESYFQSFELGSELDLDDVGAALGKYSLRCYYQGNLNIEPLSKHYFLAIKSIKCRFFDDFCFEDDKTSFFSQCLGVWPYATQTSKYKSFISDILKMTDPFPNNILKTVAFSFIEELILEILKENVETKLLTRGTATRMARKMAKKWGSIYLDNATFCAFREFIKKFISVSCKDFFIYSPLKTIDDEFVKKTFPIHEK